MVCFLFSMCLFLELLINVLGKMFNVNLKLKTNLNQNPRLVIFPPKKPRHFWPWETQMLNVYFFSFLYNAQVCFLIVYYWFLGFEFETNARIVDWSWRIFTRLQQKPWKPRASWFFDWFGSLFWRVFLEIWT